MTLIQSTQPASAFIVRPHGRYEVIIHETFTDENGILVARVQYVGDLLGHLFEIEANRIEVEAGNPETETVEVITWDENWQPVKNIVPKFVMK